MSPLWAQYSRLHMTGCEVCWAEACALSKEDSPDRATLLARKVDELSRKLLREGVASGVEELVSRGSSDGFTFFTLRDLLVHDLLVVDLLVNGAVLTRGESLGEHGAFDLILP
jgi:hypothetical protein